MKASSPGTLAAGLIGLAALVLLSIGAPGDRKPAAPAPDASAQALPARVSAGGFSLASTSVDLPVDDAPYPDGPHADVVNANCTSCHSASMALTQPALSPDQWKAIVTKMRDVYKAPVAEKDVPAIVDYLAASSGRKATAATATAQPGATPAASGQTG